MAYLDALDFRKGRGAHAADGLRFLLDRGARLGAADSGSAGLDEAPPPPSPRTAAPPQRSRPGWYRRTAAPQPIAMLLERWAPKHLTDQHFVATVRALARQADAERAGSARA